MEERRERINNFLSKLMKEKFDNEDLIIARDIAEAEAEWEKREREKMKERSQISDFFHLKKLAKEE